MEQTNKTSEELFRIPTEYIKSVIGGFHNAFIFLGEIGQGKTFTTIKILQNENTKFIYHSGISTPFALYKFLYEHRENEILCFDDCSGLINNPYALSILLSALWTATDKRVISWNTTKIKDVPTSFIFNSKVIIITNKMPKTYAQVVLSRCLTYELKLSYFQLLDFMYEIGDKEVVNYIKDNSSPATRGFDLRLLRKAESFKAFDKDNWKFLIKPMLKDVDEHIQILIQALKTNPNNIKFAEKEWCDKTQMSRRTFYRKKAELVC